MDILIPYVLKRWFCEAIYLHIALIRMFLARAVSLPVRNPEVAVEATGDDAHKLEHDLHEKADCGGGIVGNNNSIDPSQKTNFPRLCAT